VVRDYDAQLLESVAARRRRLRDALVHGSLRNRRSVDEGVSRLFIGAALAAVLCTGCVGWSFVENRVLPQRAAATDEVQPASSPTGSVSRTSSIRTTSR